MNFQLCIELKCTKTFAKQILNVERRLLHRNTQHNFYLSERLAITANTDNTDLQSSRMQLLL